MLKARGVRPHSFAFLQWYWKWTPCRNLTVLQFPGAINIFWVFHSIGVKLTGNIHTTHTFKLAVLTHTHKSPSTHKVQESASRTAIGAVLPTGLILVSLCFTMSMFHILIPRCNHLLSIQSLAGTVLSFQLPPLM